MCAASFARVSPEVFGLLVYFSEIDYERNKTGNVNINKIKFCFHSLDDWGGCVSVKERQNSKHFHLKNGL